MLSARPLTIVFASNNKATMFFLCSFCKIRVNPIEHVRLIAGILLLRGSIFAPAGIIASVLYCLLLYQHFTLAARTPSVSCPSGSGRMLGPLDICILSADLLGLALQWLSHRLQTCPAMKYWDTRRGRVDQLSCLSQRKQYTLQAMSDRPCRPSCRFSRPVTIKGSKSNQFLAQNPCLCSLGNRFQAIYLQKR